MKRVVLAYLCGAATTLSNFSESPFLNFILLIMSFSFMGYLGWVRNERNCCNQ